MGTSIGRAAAARMLAAQDKIMIITHVSPDGDTLGSGFALYHALSAMNKRVCVVNSDRITPKYCFLSGAKSVLRPQFEPQFIVAVDVGSVNLIGKELEEYVDRIDMCIDHHPSNSRYAKYNLIDAHAAAAGEIMLDVITAMHAPMSREIADALYTAISTDTACFRHSSTTATTLRKAARTIELGADIEKLNNYLFVVKSKQLFELERLAMDNIRFYRNSTIAVMPITLEMMKKSGATEDDTDGIATLPRQIQGVEVGITMREVKENEYRISARSDGRINVSAICQRLGGGGHVRASGARLTGSTDEIIERIVAEVLAEYREVEGE
jgi:phosphoesterase RecJ-like protein